MSGARSSARSNGARRVLLTGASGLIGSHAPAALRERGFEVHALTSGELREADAESGVAAWHHADLLDPAAAHDLIERVRPTHLLHLAWYAEHGLFWRSIENVRWVEASLRLLRAFAEAQGERAVLVGTCAEYDWSAGGRFTEEASPLAPATLYGTSKHALRTIAAAMCEQQRVELAWGRVFFLFGPHEHPERLVPSVARAVLAGHPAPCSHGRQLRDFLYSADVADAFAALLDSEVSGAVNIGSGEPTSIGELVRSVGAAAGDARLIRLGELPARQEEPAELVADVGRLREEVGWTPRLTLAEGVERTVRWWRERDESPPSRA
jgi:nucleoside-diphosphate-sugar epimerase